MAETIYNPDAPQGAKKPAPKKAAPARQPSPLASASAVDTGHPQTTADMHLTGEHTAPMSDREKLQADVARIRGMRKPFGAFTQKLALPARPGYHRHWFSDEPGRIDEAMACGWAHVKDSEEKPVKRVVGRGRDGAALFGYAMELPLVFWEEDMAARHDAATARIDDIRKNPIKAAPGTAKEADRDKFYVPDSRPVEISQSLVRHRQPGT